VRVKAAREKEWMGVRAVGQILGFSGEMASPRGFEPRLLP
jgi:hypothetical protein